MRFFKVDNIIAIISFATLFGSNSVASLSESTKKQVYSLMNGGLIQGSEKIFNELIETPRKHSVLVQFTALDPSFDCKICHFANGLLNTIAQAWQKTSNPEDLYFVTIDYSKAPNVFKKYQLTSAPIVYIFPASDIASESPTFMDLKGIGPKMEPEEIIKYLEKNLGVKIPYSKPTDYKKLASFFGVAVSSLLVAYLAFLRFSKVVFSTKAWSSSAVVFILTMISGQMWNSIRGAQFVSSHRDGSIEWFAGGFQDQLGLESQIVAVVYGVATASIILLGYNVTKVKSPTLQSVFSIILILIFLGCLSFISALFKRKISHYPYNIYFQ